MHLDQLRETCDALSADLVAWRRELHRHPELGFEERRTAAFLEERLRRLGLEVRPGLARTGLAALLRAGSRSQPAVLLRADMDGLPIQETPGRDYGSEISGKMHACGHDAHMAMLLGAATLLAPLADRLPRDVLFCFQPAEEGQGGAERMIQEGVLELSDVGAVFALHVWSQLEAGNAQVRPGPMLAAQDEFRARVIGRGGHGAMPHAAIDPIVAAAQGVVALQSIVSRDLDPNQPAVVTVGSIHGGSAPNVIPDEVRLQGTLRSFTEEVRDLLRGRVEEQLNRVAEGARCRLEFELLPGFPAVVNDPASVRVVRRLARTVFGDDGVQEPAPLAASEDFAYFLQKMPGAYVLVGAGNRDAGIDAPHHSSRFDIDESVLPRGTELLVRLALEPGGLS
jgi:amidohydrolase